MHSAHSPTNEYTPLLTTSNDLDNVSTTITHTPKSSIHRHLYISHFLSAWNSRVFEFGAVLYLTYIFPGTLRPVSVYAFARSVSAILFSHAVGRYIDSRNRLLVARLSIGRSSFLSIKIILAVGSNVTFCILLKRYTANISGYFLRSALGIGI